MKLGLIAHSRTGDKGNTSNISVISYLPEHYPHLLQHVTAESVKAHFSDLVGGAVTRYELPEICALNFVLEDALGGGVTRSLALDAHGKSLSSALLDLEIPPLEKNGEDRASPSVESALAQPEMHLPKAEDFLLWPPNVQAYGYRMVDSLFASRPVLKGDRVRPLKYGKRLDTVYGSGGGTFTTADFMDRNSISGLILLKDDEVVIERYGLGLKDSDRWSTMSTVKSLTAMLVGAAVKDGAIASINDKVAKYVPELQGSAYETVSVLNLLTMSSGVVWNEDYADKGSDVNRYSKSLADKVPGGVFKLMRELKQDHLPGTRWHYNTGDTFLLGAVIRSATKRSLASYLREKIWVPCGMEFDAFYTLESEGGLEIGGSRAGIALRDFARLASFVLHDGVIEGNRVLPEDWVGTAGQVHFAFTDADRQDMPLIVSGGIKGYGYSWWIGDDDAMIAVGFAGQRIYINRKEKIVMVTLGAFPQEKYRGPGDHDRVAEVVAFTNAAKALL